MRFVSSAKFTPLEDFLLAALVDKLDGQARSLVEQQINAINHIQRLIDWTEIDFYCLKFPKFRRKVSWPEEIKFPNRSEFKLAELDYSCKGRELKTRIFAVSGNVFSLESDEGLKPYAFSKNIRMLSVSVHPSHILNH